MDLQTALKTTQEDAGILVDVREPEELFERAHPKALHVPYSLLIQNKIPTNLPRDKKLILFCRSGKRAKHAEAILQAHAFDAIAIPYSVDDLLDITIA